MKLYFSPGSCALAPHIVAREAGHPVEASRVTFTPDARTTAEGEDYYAINTKGGYVPALKLDSGEVMTEGLAIQQYLAKDAAFMPEYGSMDYYRVLEWQAFVSSELHKGFGPLFRATASESDKEYASERLRTRYTYVDKALADREYLTGSFTIADAYLYTILRWSDRAGIALSECPNLDLFVRRMEQRDGVRTALEEEGLQPLTTTAV